MIVEAKTEHAQAICDVIKQSIKKLCVADHKGDPNILDPWLSNKTAKNCAIWIENTNAKSFVALSNNKPIGISQVGVNGYIFLCYLHPDEIGKGIGKQLLIACEKQALTWGVEDMVVDSSYTAKPFYESQGYTSHGKPYKEDNLRSYPLIKKLKP